MEIQVFHRHRAFLRVCSGLSALLFLVGYCAYELVDKKLLATNDICPKNPLFHTFIQGVVGINNLIEVWFHLGTLLYTLVLFCVWCHAFPQGTVRFMVKCTLLLAVIHFSLCAKLFVNFKPIIHAVFSGFWQNETCQISETIARQVTKMKVFVMSSLGSYVLVLILIFELLIIEIEIHGVEN